MDVDRSLPHSDGSVRACADRGSTFLEIVISVALIGVTVGAILTAMQTLIISSSFSKTQASTEVVLGSAADRIAGWRYIPCPTPDGENSYLPAVQGAAGDARWPTSTVSITSIRYWIAPEGAPASDGHWADNNSLGGAQCNQSASLTTSATLQLIGIRVESPDGRYVRTIEVVKHNVHPQRVYLEEESTP